MEEIFFDDYDTGEKIKFFIIDRVEISNQLYLLTTEAQTDEEIDEDIATECYIMKAIKEENDEISFRILEEEQELGVIQEIFNDRLEDFTIA